MQKIGKEVKIGLAVIGVLLVAFGYVLVKKLTQHDDPGTDTAAAAAPSAGAASDGASRPTVVTASDSDRGGDVAADPKRSRWSVGADPDVKKGDPAADSRSPFAPTVRETAATPEPHGASHFAGDDNSTAADSVDSHRRDAHADDHRFGGAVQTSDTAPIPAATADGSAPSDSRSLFAKGDASKSVGDKDPAGDGSATAKSSADPFQRRSADAAAPSNPFERRAADAAHAADASAATDAAPRKSLDGSFDGHDSAAKSFADRSATRSTPLSPADDAGLKPTVSGDAPSDAHNPLRRADIQPPADASDAGNRWSGPNRQSGAASAAGPGTIPTRSGSAFDSSSRSDPPSRLDPATPVDGGNRFNSGTATVANGTRLSGVGTAQPLVADESAAKPGQYVVQPNDNYWTISEKVYGTGGYFKAIFEHNRRQHPTAERLQVGETLLVPAVADLQRDYPDLCPKPGHAAAPQRIIPASARLRPGTRVYAVEEGDTLFEIARRQLGKPSRWGEIYQLNREVLGSDFDYLKPGTELLIPTNETRPDPIARQPNGTAEK